MATRTVVCPDCGAAAAPGRYACAECGALLASVGAAPRVLESVALREEPATLPEPAPATDGGSPAPGSIISDSVTPELEPVESAESAFDENAPLAASAVGQVRHPPAVLHDLAGDPGDAAGEDSDQTPASADEAQTASPAAAAPSWPPPGDLGTIVRPEPRTPAGSYLPPSAVLPPLDVATPSTAPLAAAAAAPGDSFLARASDAVAEAFGSVRVADGGARRTMLVGAAIVTLGLLLPWVNGLPGASPVANYLDRWGLAGPGIWLVLVACVVLVMVAGSAGRPATWALRLPAVALAAFAIGLVWPYLMGGQGRGIGVWVVVVGAIVLAAGGFFERPDRHAPDDGVV